MNSAITSKLQLLRDHRSRSLYNAYITLVLCQILTLEYVSAQDSQDSDQHLQKANSLLASGQLNDALVHYNSAVEKNPSNYQGRYRRATCLLALGRTKQAIPDLDKVIELQPTFWQAKNQRASVYLKQGKFEDALKDFEACKAHSQEARNSITEVKSLHQHFKNAELYMNKGRYDYALKSLEKIKEKVPWSAKTREMIADCYEYYGDIDKTMNNLKPLVQISPSTAPETYLRLAKLYYLKAELQFSLDQIRECLKIDPDHKKCFTFYKIAKKLNKQFEMAKKLCFTDNKYDDAISKMDMVIATSEKVEEFQTAPSSALKSLFLFQKCKIYEKSGPENANKAIDLCNQAIQEIGEGEYEAIDIIKKVAEIHESQENWDAALRSYRTIESIDPNNPNGINIDDKIEKCEKMKKRAKSRDYYKILKLSRKNCRAKDVRSQYKKLALIYHPDRCSKNEDTKGWSAEKCEQAFRDIADAKEVLSDKEKKAMFDEGVDPLDAEEQAEQNRGGGGGHPFPHGFNPFGNGGPFGGGGHGGQGGNGGFKFHFNF